MSKNVSCITQKLGATIQNPVKLIPKTFAETSSALRKLKLQHILTKIGFLKEADPRILITPSFWVLLNPLKRPNCLKPPFFKNPSKASHYPNPISLLG